MKLTLENLPPHIRKLNAHLFVGGLEKPVVKQDSSRALDRLPTPRKSGPQSVVCCLVRHGRRKLDDDNLAGGFKPLRDAIAASLRIDDGDARIRWQYGQVETTGRQGTVVTITTLDNQKEGI